MADQALKIAPGATETREMRILVIDDNDFDRQRVLRLCQRAGLRFESREASTLDEVRRALAETVFDLIFVDYHLGGETGLDAIDLVASHPNQRAAAAVMLAGDGQIAVAVEAMRRGCSDYLTKAMMTVETLQKSIATALERCMIVAAIDEERATRAALERAIQDYASTCTAEMRTILSATLRRVRGLRSHVAQGTEALTTGLGGIERDIDRLWGALPDFRAEARRVTTTRSASVLHLAPPT